MSEAPERPPRPMLPVSLWALLATIGLTRFLLSTGLDSGLLMGCALAGLLVTVCVSAPLFRLWAGAALVLVLGVSISCACLSCGVALASQRALAERLSTSPVSAWQLRVEADMTRGASGWRGRAAVLSDGAVAGEVWLISDEPLDLGDTVSAVGRFERNGDDEWGSVSRAQGLAGTVRVVMVTSRLHADGAWGMVLGARRLVLERLDATSSDARALVAGAVCGSTAAMSERGLDDLFSRCGVSHLVAVSGGHLVLVCSVLGLLLSRAPTGPLVRAFLLLLVSAAFVAFSGGSDSAVRSWAMALVAELSRLFGRRAHPLSGACLVGLVMVLVEPGVTGRLGFLLSVACVCGICALGSYARYVLDVLTFFRGPRRTGWAGPVFRGVVGPASDALSMTIVSQVVTAPLTCSTFGTLSLVAPLANVLLAPLFSMMLVVGLVFACLAATPLSGPMLILCEAIGVPLVALAEFCSSLPLASVAVSVDETTALAVLAVALLILLAWWPRASRRALLASISVVGAVALCWHLRWRVFAPACVRVLDVGQGDAILVTEGTAAVLVDTGPDDSIVEALGRSHVTHLDAVVLTHLHADHAGGLEELLSVVEVDALVVPEGTDVSSLPDTRRVSEIGHGDVLTAGGFALRAVSPLEPSGGEDNEGSLVLLLDFDDGTRSLSALLAADAESEETWAAICRGEVADVDLLKVGHHGSRASVTPQIAEALSPEVSVASAGEGNSYGHPDPVCVDVLSAAGSLFLCTMDAGDVCVEPGETGPVVSCQKEAGMRGHDTLG